MLCSSIAAFRHRVQVQVFLCSEQPESLVRICAQSITSAYKGFISTSQRTETQNQILPPCPKDASEESPMSVVKYYSAFDHSLWCNTSFHEGKKFAISVSIQGYRITCGDRNCEPQPTYESLLFLLKEAPHAVMNSDPAFQMPRQTYNNFEILKARGSNNAFALTVCCCR